MAYQIRSGDTLSGIAARNHTTVAALLRANPQIHNPNLIRAGASLNLPGSSDSFQPAPSTGGGRYTVRPGDTLSKIGARFGVSYQAIARANGIANPNLIFAGQQLTIPGRGTTPAPGPAPTPAPAPGPTGGVSGIENRPGVRGNAQQAIDFFMSKGLSRAQAAGIAGNLLYESGFNPSAVGDGGTSFGIAQWHQGRGAAMKQWTKAQRLLEHLVQGAAGVPVARAEPQREQRPEQAALVGLGLRRGHGVLPLLRAPGGDQPGARPGG